MCEMPGRYCHIETWSEQRGWICTSWGLESEMVADAKQKRATGATNRVVAFGTGELVLPA